MTGIRVYYTYRHLPDTTGPEWQVGYCNPNGAWICKSTHGTEELAAAAARDQNGVPDPSESKIEELKMPTYSADVRFRREGSGDDRMCVSVNGPAEYVANVITAAAMEFESTALR